MMVGARAQEAARLEDAGRETPVVRGRAVKTDHTMDFSGRVLVAGGVMAGAAFAGGALWGPVAAIATGALGFALGLLLNDE
jgi:hypothetical protein